MPTKTTIYKIWERNLKWWEKILVKLKLKKPPVQIEKKEVFIITEFGDWKGVK